MSDLWPEIQSIECEENNSVAILREQARAIDKKTNGAIKATFSKITYKKNGLSELSKVVSVLSGTNTMVEEDDLLNDKTDVNTLYRLEKYKFEIYSNTYKFRVFTVDNRTVFPIYINIDEGICAELNCQQREEVSSNRELEELVSSVFHSNKLKTILSRMLADKDNKSSEKTSNVEQL